MIILRSQLSIVVDNILSNSLVQSLDSSRNISISYSTIVVSCLSRSLGSREYSLSLSRGRINCLIVIVTCLSTLYSCVQCLVSINRSISCGDSISSSVDSLDRTIGLEFSNSRLQCSMNLSIHLRFEECITLLNNRTRNLIDSILTTAEELHREVIPDCPVACICARTLCFTNTHANRLTFLQENSYSSLVSLRIQIACVCKALH